MKNIEILYNSWISSAEKFIHFFCFSFNDTAYTIEEVSILTQEQKIAPEKCFCEPVSSIG